MENLIERQQKAYNLVQRILDLDPDEGTQAYAMKMREHLKLPMSMVLDKLDKVWPGTSVIERSKRLGVTRQAYYGWLNGIYRPDKKIARKLAALTGLDEEDIRGRLPARRA